MVRLTNQNQLDYLSGPTGKVHYRGISGLQKETVKFKTDIQIRRNIRVKVHSHHGFIEKHRRAQSLSHTGETRMVRKFRWKNKIKIQEMEMDGSLGLQAVY